MTWSNAIDALTTTWELDLTLVKSSVLILELAFRAIVHCGTGAVRATETLEPGIGTQQNATRLATGGTSD